MVSWVWIYASHALVLVHPICIVLHKMGLLNKIVNLSHIIIAWEGTMIIRVLQAKVHPGREAEFKRIIELLSLPQIRSKSEVVDVFPGQLPGSGSTEFLLVTIWKNLSKVKKMTLEEWVRMILPEEALPLLAEWQVQFYDSFGTKERNFGQLFNYMKYQPDSV
jgi:hypothetical protein